MDESDTPSSTPPSQPSAPSSPDPATSSLSLIDSVLAHFPHKAEEILGSINPNISAAQMNFHSEVQQKLYMVHLQENGLLYFTEANEHKMMDAKDEVNEMIADIKTSLDDYAISLEDKILYFRMENEAKIRDYGRSLIIQKAKLESMYVRLKTEPMEDEELSEYWNTVRGTLVPVTEPALEVHMDVSTTPYYHSLNRSFHSDELIRLRFKEYRSDDFCLSLISDATSIFVNTEVRCRVLSSRFIETPVDDIVKMGVYAHAGIEVVPMKSRHLLSANICEFTFVPLTPGIYVVDARMRAFHIRGSPIMVLARSENNHKVGAIAAGFTESGPKIEEDLPSSMDTTQSCVIQQLNSSLDGFSQNTRNAGCSGENKRSTQSLGSLALENYGEEKEEELFRDRNSFTPKETPKSKIGKRPCLRPILDAEMDLLRSNGHSITSFLGRSNSVGSFVRADHVWKTILNKPSSLIVLSKSPVLVAISGSRTKYSLKVLDFEGQFVRKIILPRSLKNPSNLVALRDDRFALKDDKDILVFDSAGELMSEYEALDSTCMTSDGSDNLITLVARKGAICVVFFEAITGRVVNNIDISLKNTKILDCRCLHYNDNNVYALNGPLSLVYILELATKTAKTIGALGPLGRDHIHHPIGIGTDYSGNCIVAESNRLQVFDKRGQFLTKCVTSKPLRRLTEFTLDSKRSEFYVLCSVDDTVTKFKLKNE